jgi:hypothetical protein
VKKVIITKVYIETDREDLADAFHQEVHNAVAVFLTGSDDDSLIQVTEVSSCIKDDTREEEDKPQ